MATIYWIESFERDWTPYDSMEFNTIQAARLRLIELREKEPWRKWRIRRRVKKVEIRVSTVR